MYIYVWLKGPASVEFFLSLATPPPPMAKKVAAKKAAAQLKKTVQKKKEEEKKANKAGKTDTVPKEFPPEQVAPEEVAAEPVLEATPLKPEAVEVKSTTCVEKVKKAVSEATRAKGHCKTTLNQWVKSENPELRAQGEMLLQKYNSFSGELQASFAKKVLDSKASKDFSWTREFTQELAKQEQESGGCSEDYMTRPQILQLKGLKMKDFPSQEKAFEAADEIIADQRASIQNLEEFLENFPDKISQVAPLANMYWFIKSHGRTSTWTTNRNRRVEMSTSFNAKHMSAIQNQGEGLKLLEDVLGEKGQQVLTGGGSSSTVKAEFPLLAEIDRSVEALE